jgi:hypothetical protein
MTAMRGDEVHPGDAIDYHGELHHITCVERRDGWAWPIAYDDAGWAMALGRNVVVLHGQPDTSSTSC